MKLRHRRRAASRRTPKYIRWVRTLRAAFRKAYPALEDTYRVAQQAFNVHSISIRQGHREVTLGSGVLYLSPTRVMGDL